MQDDQAQLEQSISALLVGTDPRIIGAALMSITATFFASHHPIIRQPIIKLHEEAVHQMIPIAERLLVRKLGGLPWTPEPPRPDRYKPASVKTSDTVERYLVLPEDMNVEEAITHGGRGLSHKVVAQCSEWNVASRIAIALNLLVE